MLQNLLCQVPWAVWRCRGRHVLPTAEGSLAKDSGNTMQEVQYALPRGSVEVSSKSSIAQCPNAVRQCAAGVPLHTNHG